MKGIVVVDRSTTQEDSVSQFLVEALAAHFRQADPRMTSVASLARKVTGA